MLLILSLALEGWQGHCPASQCLDRHLAHLCTLGTTHLLAPPGLPRQQPPSPLGSWHSQGRALAKLATMLPIVLSRGAIMLHLPSIRPLGLVGPRLGHLETHLLDEPMTTAVSSSQLRQTACSNIVACWAQTLQHTPWFFVFSRRCV